MTEKRILLESGTNEVEVLEFVLGQQSFGVNVLKIQAIEQFDPSRVTRIQLAHPAVVGTLLFRESCVTLIDLAQNLGCQPEAKGLADEAACAVADLEGRETTPASDTRGCGFAPEDTLVLVMEFNDLMTAFLVDGVNRIHRASWNDISPLSPYLNSSESKFTGSLNIAGNEILVVDMEKVVADIIPNDYLQHRVVADEDCEAFGARPGVNIFLAEDSVTIREKVLSELAKANYTNVRPFTNGKDCYDAIARLQQEASNEGRQLADVLDGVVSDIEMPRMDGLALCRNIKETMNGEQVPVIMFSSLINDQISRKCESVGADAFVSKPQFTKLVELLDSHCLSVAVSGS